jgi:hypothetical protein
MSPWNKISKRHILVEISYKIIILDLFWFTEAILFLKCGDFPLFKGKNCYNSLIAWLEIELFWLFLVNVRLINYMYFHNLWNQDTCSSCFIKARVIDTCSSPPEVCIYTALVSTRVKSSACSLLIYSCNSRLGNIIFHWI